MARNMELMVFKTIFFPKSDKNNTNRMLFYLFLATSFFSCPPGRTTIFLLCLPLCWDLWRRACARVCINNVRTSAFCYNYSCGCSEHCTQPVPAGHRAAVGHNSGGGEDMALALCPSLTGCVCTALLQYLRYR